MKDSIIFEGKNYISSRRASEISDYAADYIGQLCRAGKLDCRMVGRSWFVTEESLHAHKEQVMESESARDRIQNIRKSKIGGLVSNADLDADSNVDVSLDSDDEENVLNTPVDLVYEKDERPLLPELMTGSPVPSIGIMNVEEHEGSMSDASVAVLPQSLGLSKYKKFAVLAVVTAFIFGGMMMFEFVPGKTGGAVTGEAGTASAIASLMSSLRNGFDKLAGFFGNRLASQNGSQLAVDDTGNLSPEISLPWDGIAVVPSAGSDFENQIVEQRIRNSFSDEVEIKPDDKGTAGVITPVFQTANGDDFVYVLVPVKEEKEKNQTYE